MTMELTDRMENGRLLALLRPEFVNPMVWMGNCGWITHKRKREIQKGMLAIRRFDRRTFEL